MHSTKIVFRIHKYESEGQKKIHFVVKIKVLQQQKPK